MRRDLLKAPGISWWVLGGSPGFPFKACLMSPFQLPLGYSWLLLASPGSSWHPLNLPLPGLPGSS